MTTSRIIALTAAIMACAAPAASASPAIDPPAARAHVAQPVTSASIAAHHEQLSNQQYLASHAQPAPAVASAPLTDRTDTDAQFPLVFVLLGLTIPLGIALAAVVAQPVRA